MQQVYGPISYHIFIISVLLQLPFKSYLILVIYRIIYRVAQNKIPHRRICNISATNGLILKILEAA